LALTYSELGAALFETNFIMCIFIIFLLSRESSVYACSEEFVTR